jgi:tRNA nucleotidyltransferase/poly(A) polymerase
MAGYRNPREFAVEIVARLQLAGFQALFAGGCVRDQIMGIEPQDYDVATSATPDEVRAVFGARRTRAIGQAFGVIAVYGGPRIGQVEVATFRQDGVYSDGRHPDQVVFSDVEHDAARRDFTINGIFYDPVADRVLDFVGGVADIQGRRIRAIGQAEQRFAEDHLRMLRAPRFAARFDFEIEPSTLKAIQRNASRIRTVSGERIGNELRLMLAHRNRERAFYWLRATRLWAVMVSGADGTELDEHDLDEAAEILTHLKSLDFELALAAILKASRATGDLLRELADQWRLTNRESERVGWLLSHVDEFRTALDRPWAHMQRLLIHRDAPLAVELGEAIDHSPTADWRHLDFCRHRLSWPVETLNPPPLIDGHDLLAMGLPAGPSLGRILNDVRDRQLEGFLRTRSDALAWAAGMAQRDQGAED